MSCPAVPTVVRILPFSRSKWSSHDTAAKPRLASELSPPSEAVPRFHRSGSQAGRRRPSLTGFVLSVLSILLTEDSRMTNTIQTPTDTATEGEEFLHLDPADIIIGTNVRADLPDTKGFRKSIKERGVLEAVTVYRDEDGRYVLLRGQRRAVTAAEVGTPTGLIPARVVPRPEDADRIGDQMVENIHRAGMRATEIVAGVEQLALLGVSAAQIAKRTSIDRPTVNAALAVTKADQTRNRLDSGDLSLDEAAIFAEFEHDPDAVERLERAGPRAGATRSSTSHRSCATKPPNGRPTEPKSSACAPRAYRS